MQPNKRNGSQMVYKDAGEADEVASELIHQPHKLHEISFKVNLLKINLIRFLISAF